MGDVKGIMLKIELVANEISLGDPGHGEYLSILIDELIEAKFKELMEREKEDE